MIPALLAAPWALLKLSTAVLAIPRLLEVVR